MLTGVIGKVNEFIVYDDTWNCCNGNFFVAKLSEGHYRSEKFVNVTQLRQINQLHSIISFTIGYPEDLVNGVIDMTEDQWTIEIFKSPFPFGDPNFDETNLTSCCKDIFFVTK